MSFVANDQDGQLMEGIAWARNRMGHQRAVVLDKHYGTELGTWVVGLGVLGTRDHLKWAPVSAIPAGISNRGREIYVRRMAGQPVSDAIDAARRWVKTMGSVCGL